MRMRGVFRIGAVLLLAVVLWFAGTRLFFGGRVSCRDCNVLLIVVDPLRADALDTYGNTRKATPFLDGISGAGYQFDNAVAVAPWTLPSAMSLMTGVYPSTHAITNKDIIPGTDARTMVPANLATASPSIRTFAEEFRDAGYKTGAFAGGSALSHSYGFDKGFDAYESEEGFMGLTTVIPKALDFIRQNKGKKLFVMVQGFDVHGQYLPEGGLDRRYIAKDYAGTLTGSTEEQKKIREEGVTLGRVFLRPEDRDFLRGVYDEKTARMDATVGSFIEAYKNVAPLEKTIVIITSNHGDEFYEHGRIDHGMTLYDEVIRIPLIVAVPGGKGMRIRSQVRNIDILPTAFSLAGHTLSQAMQKQLEGVDVTPLLSGRTMRLDAFPETAYRYASFATSVRTWDGWKLIVNNETQEKQLFHLAEDPKESKNVFASNGSMAASLLKLLEDHRNKTGNSGKKGY